MSNVRSLDSGYYEALRRLTLELAGVQLGSDAEFLVETRLTALARSEGYGDLPSMIDELFSEGKTRLAVHVVSALLERDMRFFDDKSGFESLRNTVLGKLALSFPGQTLRILCYGCGTGQDIFSLAMTLAECQQSYPGVKFELLGVDYPSRGLERAMTGRFTHFEVQRGLPARYLVKYFTRNNEDWVVSDALRENISFKEFHLLSNLEPLGEFHMIAFRNNLARYAATSQMRIIRSLVPVLHVDGHLMLGSTETLGELNFGLDPLATAKGFYRKRPAPLPPPEPEKILRKDFN